MIYRQATSRGEGAGDKLIHWNVKLRTAQFQIATKGELVLQRGQQLTVGDNLSASRFDEQRSVEKVWNSHRLG